jgi:hypothetical protein
MSGLKAIRVLSALCIVTSVGAMAGGVLIVRWMDQNWVMKTRAEVEEAEFVSDLEIVKEIARSSALSVVASFKALRHTVLISTGVLAVLTVGMAIVLFIALRIQA